VQFQNLRRQVTSCDIVQSKDPSLVDRVLKIFSTPADSLNAGIATFYDESSTLWEDVRIFFPLSLEN
jgi:hypothetical protein